MKRLALLSAALLTIPGAASAQSLTLTNLKAPIARICKVSQAKTIAQLWQQINACNVVAPAPAPPPAPTPAPTPTPPPAPLSGTLSEGDSNSVFWSGNHTGIYAAAHPSEPFYGKAVGGSLLADLEKRFAANAALRPARVTVMIGTNYMSPTFLADLAAYAARWKAMGAKAYLSTLLPKCDAAFNAARGPANAGIRSLGYEVIDHAADPVIGPDAAGCDKLLYSDGVHLTDVGQQRAALVYSAKLDGKPAPSVPAPPVAAFPQAPQPDLNFGVSLAQGTVASWGNGGIPGPYDKHEGAFRFVCGGDGPLANDDPVIYPSQPGAAHLHDVWGNRSFDAFTTPETLAKSAATNCNDTPFSLNRSSYWQPALIHDGGQAIRPDLVLVYYKRVTARSPYCDPKSTLFMGICTTLPNRIRFVFGWDQFKPTAPIAVSSAQWSCTGAPGHYPDLDAVFAAGCKPGDTLTAMTLAPNCWDGKNLDSADHRSHMAYSNYVRCPTSHPYLIPQEENKAQFTVTADMVTADRKPRIRLSSDHMLPGAKPGTTLHADYIEAWQGDAKQVWHDHCIDKALSCSGGDLGNGRQLIGAAQPRYGWLNPTPRALPAL